MASKKQMDNAVLLVLLGAGVLLMNTATRTVRTIRKGAAALNPFDVGTAEEKAIWTDFRNAPFWNPDFILVPKKAGKHFQFFDVDTANALVHKFHDSKGILNDDEDAVNDVLSRIKYQTQFVQLATQFKNVYGKRFDDYLGSFMQPKELAPQLKRILNLSTGIV